MELLRFATAGSVDDGKSTLIGRLLYDSKQIFEDTLDALEHTSRLRGEEEVNLALLTDGLRAEREQGITIDVAYRYFATPKRKFIIADTPGHIQYTRNMITGASTANLALILIDARNGILEQSRRHAFLASLLGVPAPRALRQQDGPRRLRPGRVRAHQGRVPRLRDQARRARPRVHPGVGAARRQRGGPLRQHALVRRHEPPAPPRRGAHRLRPQPDRLPVRGAVRDPPARRPRSTTTAATRARCRAAPTSRATKWWCCPRASRRRSRRSTPPTARSTKRCRRCR